VVSVLVDAETSLVISWGKGLAITLTLAFEVAVV